VVEPDDEMRIGDLDLKVEVSRAAFSSNVVDHPAGGFSGRDNVLQRLKAAVTCARP